MPAGAIAREQAAHIPRWVEASLRSGGRPAGPSADARSAAVLLIDIAGFTARTDAALGDGAEGLTDFINNCFAILTEVISRHDGDIVAFAGDAILAVWDDDDPATATDRAARCGLALRDALAAWRDGGGIDQRTAVEAGEVFFCRLGGWLDSWHYVAVGDPFYSIGAAYRSAKIGDVVLCSSAAAILSTSSDAEIAPYGARLLRMPTPHGPQEQERIGNIVETGPPSAGPEQRLFDAGAWVGEFRTLTVARVALPELNFDHGFLTKIQSFVLEAQQVSDRLEGSIHQIQMDDKGMTLTLIFGLTPFAHEDDPLRAVEASLRMRRQLAAKGIPISVGISTGRLFCSNYGGRQSQTFGVFGKAMNVAAHLAEAAQGDIACDATTAEAVGRGIAFNLLPHIHLKGADASMLAFRPTATAEELHRHSTGRMIDRESERAILQSCIDDVSAGSGRFALVSGEAGIGKSRLLEEFVSLAEANGRAVLLGSATAIEKSTPYFVWRTILRQLLKLESGGDAARVRAEVSELLSGERALLSWLPVLDEVIALGFPQTEFTRQIIGSARATAIEELVVCLLRKSHFRILVVEDLHWLDGSSMDLLAAVARRVPEFLLVVSQRTQVPKIADENLLEDLAPSLQIRLERLSRDHVALMIKQRLRATEIPPSLVRFVYNPANGNPFFCGELVLALRDTGRIQVSRGVCSFDEQNAAIESLSLPTSVERAIVSRIDALSADDQLLLKAASTIGDAFSIDMLENIVPELAVASKEASIRRLVDHDFLQPDPEARPLSFVFRHSITMEVAYNLLSFAQRRALHERIAAFLERHYANELQPHYARLARHWELGNAPLSAIKYLELAAQQSRNNYANRESIRYAKKMFDLMQHEKLEIDNSRQAAWEVILGDAYHELSDYENSAERYARAMQLLGRHLPGNKAGKIGALMYNGSVQLVSWFLPARTKRLAQHQQADVQLVSHMYEYLSEQYFFQNDSLAVLNGTLASLNLAEQSGAAPETIRGYTALALGMAMSGLVRVARSYAVRAQRLAEKHGSLPDIARVELVLGVLAYGLGKWSDAEQHADKALGLYRRLGDRARAQMGETMAIFVAILRGDIMRANSLHANLYSDISTDSSMQVRAWSLSARVLIDTIQGNTSAEHLNGLRAIAGSKLIRTDQLLCLGIAAMGYLQRQEIDSALELAERGLAVLQECGVVWGGYVFGAAGIADVFLGLCEGAHNSRGSRQHIQNQADLACRQLSRLARTSPICRPYALLMRGRASLLAGRTARARSQWERAAAAAELLNMPREQARAIYEIGKNSPLDDPSRQKYLGKASDIFGHLGAVGELTQLRRTQSHQPTAADRGSTP
jgi:class 3 adenylate cyclase/tetratricopeptide (TPR) repeat protein